MRKKFFFGSFFFQEKRTTRSLRDGDKELGEAGHGALDTGVLDLQVHGKDGARLRVGGDGELGGPAALSGDGQVLGLALHIRGGVGGDPPGGLQGVAVRVGGGAAEGDGLAGLRGVVQGVGGDNGGVVAVLGLADSPVGPGGQLLEEDLHVALIGVGDALAQADVDEGAAAELAAHPVVGVVALGDDTGDAFVAVAVVIEDLPVHGVDEAVLVEQLRLAVEGLAVVEQVESGEKLAVVELEGVHQPLGLVVGVEPVGGGKEADHSLHLAPLEGAEELAVVAEALPGAVLEAGEQLVDLAVGAAVVLAGAHQADLVGDLLEDGLPLVGSFPGWAYLGACMVGVAKCILPHPPFPPRKITSLRFSPDISAITLPVSKSLITVPSGTFIIRSSALAPWHLFLLPGSPFLATYL